MFVFTDVILFWFSIVLWWNYEANLCGWMSVSKSHFQSPRQTLMKSIKSNIMLNYAYVILCAHQCVYFKKNIKSEFFNVRYTENPYTNNKSWNISII